MNWKIWALHEFGGSSSGTLNICGISNNYYPGMCVLLFTYAWEFWRCHELYYIFSFNCVITLQKVPGTGHTVPHMAFAAPEILYTFRFSDLLNIHPVFRAFTPGNFFYQQLSYLTQTPGPRIVHIRLLDRHRWKQNHQQLCNCTEGFA